ncbi:CAP Gly-rich domain-containing protein [Pilobolus umbonatus]|nr:CAP Gly-rich domain-containing protein [Pilobolus umbonatus]
MFRKAKKLSKRLGLNRRSVDSEHPDSTSNISKYSSMSDTEEYDLHDIEDSDSVANEEYSDNNQPPSILVHSEPSSPPAKDWYCLPPNDKPGILTRPEEDKKLVDLNELDTLLSGNSSGFRHKKEPSKSNSASPRPRHIKFDIPETRPSTRSSDRIAYPKIKTVRSLPDENILASKRHSIPPAKTRRTKWRSVFGDKDDVEQPGLPITMDTRVRLKKRPLPTFGHVRFMGGVYFGQGEWIGVELDHGVGNNNGTVDGHTYFVTDTNRGIFCKRRDLEAVPE